MRLSIGATDQDAILSKNDRGLLQRSLDYEHHSAMKVATHLVFVIFRWRSRRAGEETLDWFKAHYGNIASVLGLVVSLLGFSFTLWQVRKSRTAAERAQVRKSRTAAERAQAIAREAIERVASILFLNQITTAVRLAHDVRNSSR